MSKLKTLKYFEVNPKSWAGAMANAGRKYTIDISGLKQEAIKWIKQNPQRDFYCTICEEFNCDCSSSDCFKIYHWDDVYTWIRYFFNITEEDLKDD